jgi:hypothetical protein
MVELPAVLRLQADAKRIFQVARRHRYALCRELHEEARGHDRALADRAHGAAGDLAAVQPDRVLLEIRREPELPVGGDRRRERPREPARDAAGRELARRDEREKIVRLGLRPEQRRRSALRLHRGEPRVQLVEVIGLDCAEPDPARHHAGDYFIIPSCSRPQIWTTA